MTSSEPSDRLQPQEQQVPGVRTAGHQTAAPRATGTRRGTDPGFRPSDEDLIRKRRIVGLIALGCLAYSASAALMGHFDSAWNSGLLRAGLVLAALWLALPTHTRPAAWAGLSKWKLAGIVAFAVLIPRLKFLLPVLAIGVLLGWMLRPRRPR